MFNYLGNGGLPGIGNENPFSNAGETFMRSGGTALTLILTVGAAALPWALVLALLIALWRSNAMQGVRRRFGSSAAPKAEVPPSV